MLIVIGGPCRVGKSTLAGTVSDALGCSPVPTDALVWMLQKGAPELGVRHGTNLDKGERLFPFLAPFVEAYTASGQTLLLEGDAVAPRHVSTLAEHLPTRACFLVHLGVRPPDLARDGGWAARHSPEQLASLARFVAHASERIVEECRQFGWPYFDVGEPDRASALRAAREAILSGPT